MGLSLTVSGWLSAGIGAHHGTLFIGTQQNSRFRFTGDWVCLSAHQNPRTQTRRRRTYSLCADLREIMSQCSPYTQALAKFTNLSACAHLSLSPPTHLRGPGRVKLVDKQGDLRRAVFCGPHGPVSIASSHLKSHAGNINSCEMEIMTAPPWLSNGVSRSIRTV